MNTTIKPKPCKQCGSLFHTPMYHKVRKPIQVKTPLPRPTKRIKQYGKRSADLSDWVRDIARPYLTAKYGEHCNVMYCYSTGHMDVDHVQGKGSRPELRMSLDNVQFLCRPHHRAKTDGETLEYRY